MFSFSHTANTPTPAHTDASQCVLLGGRVPGAFVMERYYISFEANDQFGNRVKSGGDPFIARVLDGGFTLPLTCSVTCHGNYRDVPLFDGDIEDEGDGQYTVSFVPEVAGTY
eukprot:8849801-Pyramimonas_sp.AAC.2